MTDQDSEVCVISGTRRQIRELVDGSLEVRVHIDPRFKQDFHRLFPQIDTPVAIAPLALNFERLSKPEESAKGGELAKLAGIWSKDSEFHQWLAAKHPGEVFTETRAANWIRETCGVESRAEIDGDADSRGLFLRNVRHPFRQWLKNK